MNIDIETVAAITIITNILQVVFIALQFFLNRSFKGIGWWLIWSIFVALGFAFMILRYYGFLNESMGAFAQNVSIIFGLIALYIGILRFLERKENKILIYSLYGVYVIINFVYSFIYNRADVRSIVLNLSIFLLVLFSCLAIYRYKYESIKISANFVAIFMMVQGVFFLLKVIANFRNPSYGYYLSPDINTKLAYFFGLVGGLFLTFGLLAMINQKLNSDIFAAKEHFENIFNTGPDASLIINNNDGRIITVNNSFCLSTGYSKNEVIGKTTSELNIWKNAENRAEVYKMLKSNSSFENLEFEFRKRDGSLITGILSGTIIRFNNESHMIAVVHDITLRKNYEKQLKEKNQELEIANAEKDKMFSIISHDFRNALNGFMGFSELLVNDINNLSREEIISIAENMNVSSKNLFNMMNNLLEWSLFKRGLVNVKTESIPLFRIIDDTTEQMHSSAENKNISIKKSVPHDLFIITDKSILSIIIRNLISNSIKFTERGGSIKVLCEKYDSDKIKISIQDTGIGMSEEIRKNLFNVNRQSSRKGTEDEPSTGLGLLLVREYIQKLNGTINVQSEPDKCSTFTVTLPQL